MAEIPRRLTEPPVSATHWQVFARTVWLWAVHAARTDKGPEICRQLDKFCRETRLYPPHEDNLPAILEPDIGRFPEAQPATRKQARRSRTF